MAGQGQHLMECGHCRGLYLEPDLTPAGMTRFYARDYRRYYPFESCRHPDDAFVHAVRCRETGLRRARALASLVPAQGRVLEIGSGHGGFLGRLHGLRPDLRLAAIEPDESHRRMALDGAPVVFIAWDDLARTAPFDLIALFHTVEHMVDPVGDLGRLARVLENEGRVVIEVPRTRPDALRPEEIHPAHVSYFTAASLHRTCVAAGLTPQTPLAGQAALPDCLWLEAARAADGAPLPPDAPAASAPARRSRPGRMVRHVWRLLLPAALVGPLSRWRHGPALDDALAEDASGRLFRWGIGFDGLDMETVLSRAHDAMITCRPFRIADINVAKLVELRVDPAFRLTVLTADAALVDGMGVLWGLRLLGARIGERVPGVDLLDRVAALCAAQGLRPFIVGARADVLERAVAALRRKYPGFSPAGWRDGYFPPEQDDAVARQLAASGADCLIAALPYPRQDLFLARVHAASGIPFAFGVGGSLDVLAGDRVRAPLWMRSAGLEWLFRMIQEPLRLGPRYVASNGRFLLMLLSQLVVRRLARR